MNQQPMNLRRAAKIVRRHKVLIGVLMVLGLFGGAGYSVVMPPKLTSQALIVLPQPKPNIATQTLIAGSAPVLTAALPSLGSGETYQSLQKKITITDPTPNAISITASDVTSALAEKEANAVAASYIAYTSSSNSPVGPITARILVSATTAAGMPPTESDLFDGGIGALAGLLIGFILAVRKDRGDQRLRQRDQIARAIGAPVLAALPLECPGDAAGWTRFFADFDIAAEYSWQLRTVLERLGVNGPGGSNSAVTVVSVATDRKALALGPQLAAFAAASGIRTALVIGPQQPPADPAALRAVASTGNQLGNLRIFNANPADTDWRHPNARLTVVIAAVDGGGPVLPNAVASSTTVLAVTAGTVTAQDLTQVVMAARTTGSEVAGAIIGDPDKDDGTTGLVPTLARSAPRSVPTRVNGGVTEIRR